MVFYGCKVKDNSPDIAPVTASNRLVGYKKRVSLLHRTAQPLALASVRTWGIGRELVV